MNLVLNFSNFKETNPHKVKAHHKKSHHHNKAKASKKEIAADAAAVIDADTNGEITAAEFATMAKNPLIAHELIEAADVNGGGSVD
jgi:predicted DsbA family dithiol-disulfide isomerase